MSWQMIPVRFLILPDKAKLSSSIWGILSAEKEKAIRMAASYANQACLPMVVDAVGVSASSIRKNLVRDLLEYKPTVLKGNMSEIRSLVGLKHHGVGVDASAKDQETEDLLQILKD